MTTSEQKFKDLLQFSEHELKNKEEEMYGIYLKLSETAKTSEDEWYTQQKYDCLFDLLAIREWMRMKGVEVPERNIVEGY